MEIKGKRAYINGKTIAKASLKDLLSLSAAEIGKLTRDQSVRLEKRLYKVAKTRLDTVYKHNLSSYAAEAYFGDVYPDKPSKTATVQATKHRVTILKEFLNAETSTYAGIKRVFKAEEKRIFGKKGDGFQDEDERKRFWNAYMEFMHQNPRFYDQSARVQQFLGRESFWRNREFRASDLSKIVKKLDNESIEGVDIRADAGYESNI